MDTVDAILTRRSIRKYLDKPVEQEKVEILLRAAMYAPSAMNEQPWHFLVLNDKAFFVEIIRIHPHAAMLKTAPLAILVCGDLDMEKAAGNWVLDCTFASHNILLTAHSIGLGAVFTGIYPEEDRIRALVELFRLPEKIIPLALIGIGYIDGEAPKPPERFRQERVSLNRWGNRI